jgi:CheY-like chemotaxis protein
MQRKIRNDRYAAKARHSGCVPMPWSHTRFYRASNRLMQQSRPSADDIGMRIVVVEDDIALRQALGSFFKSIGVEVVAESGDGQEALDVLGSVHPDLILTDCQMPRMDGISLVRHLRARGDETPVIMMSGQTDPHVRDMALRAGVSEYLTKPLSLPMLNRVIDQNLGHAA